MVVLWLGCMGECVWWWYGLGYMCASVCGTEFVGTCVQLSDIFLYSTVYFLYK